MEPLKIFIGYDSKEPVAYHVLSHSIITRARRPVTIQPVALGQLREIFTRNRGPLESTEFSISRFLVPYLSDYKGHSLFMDCDMLCRVDINDVFDSIMTQLDKAIWVCQHDYVPKGDTKFLGQTQAKYPRKNWSSFMLFNNKLCKALTLSTVNKAPGLDLHRFKWLPDNMIGSLGLEWNWLVGEYPHNNDAKILHYTLGGPWFPGQGDCDHAEDWLNELESMTNLVSG